MPLPAALLARLKRRGILQEGEEEEVIAESYDDDSKTTSTIRKQASNAAGAPGCPNKWNPFHSCVEFCYDYWREGTPENRLPVEYNRRRLRMLKKYPLPNGWKEVYDPGVARHYYWSTETDEVSWLSPVHPKAIIG
uniref:WW domain-containing protein n=1 Tax=Plectus sambesii TaxID=2011161 RepID=A0A914UZU4_9BILA